MEYLMMALVAVGLVVGLAWLVDRLRRQQADGQVRATQEAADRVLAEARTGRNNPQGG
jgi:flagellar biogenesis protein FliO